MKKILLLALLVPYFTQAQKWEVTEMSGYARSLAPASLYKTEKCYFANRVSAGYSFSKHFAVSGYYELTTWIPHTNSVGFSGEFRHKWFFVGADGGVAYIDRMREEYYPDFWAGTTPPTPYVLSWRYKPALTYGTHLGVSVPAGKFLAAKLQVGYSSDRSRGMVRDDNYDLRFRYVYAQAGLSFRFGRVRS